MINDIRNISPDIAAYIVSVYADSSASLIDVPSPHALAHQIAANYPGLGAAFYRMVAEVAREVLTGRERETAPSLPTVSGALAGLINTKDAGWF
jgi:hypothetical protein